MAIKTRQQDVEAPPAQYAAEREIEGVLYGTRHMDPERLVRHVGKVPSLMLSLKAGTFAFDDGLMAVMRDCFDLTTAGGKELRNGYWKVHFLGKPAALAAVLLWMAEVHFVPFLAGGKQALDAAMASLGAQLGSAAQPE